MKHTKILKQIEDLINKKSLISLVIIGKNGSGKTTLMNKISELCPKENIEYYPLKNKNIHEKSYNLFPFHQFLNHRHLLYHDSFALLTMF